MRTGQRPFPAGSWCVGGWEALDGSFATWAASGEGLCLSEPGCGVMSTGSWPRCGASGRRVLGDWSSALRASPLSPLAQGGSRC